MPSIYQTVFGGNPVAPAISTYLPLSFSVNTVLGWPLESNITSPAVAEWMDCTATAGGLALQFSDARAVSTGYTTIFNNVGANTFSVLDGQGNTLAAIASGQAWVFVLADNTTLQGTWRIVQFGAGVSSANAAALAGAGLKAITTTLNERILINAQGINYTAVAADRASCLDWTGGSGGTFTIDPVGLGADWFCYIKNSGTGVLTVTPASGTIDGAASKTYNPNDSSIVLSTGTNLFTMGFGQSVASSFNFVTISLAGASGTVVLTGAQLNRISYKFTGALAGNTTVQTPASIQQYWMDNETTGAFTLTFSSGGGGSTYTLPQAQRTILYCDGLNIVQAITSGSIQFGDGTAAAPSITFASDLTLGLYKAGTDILGISTAGVQRVTVNASGQVTINAPNSGVALTVSAVSGANALTTNGNIVNTSLATWASGQTATLFMGAASDGGLQYAFGGPLQAFGVNGIVLQVPLGTTRVTVGTTGTVTINAPTSGTALVVNGAAGAANTALIASATSGNFSINAQGASGSFGGISITGGGQTPGTGSFDLYQNASGDTSAHIRQDANASLDISTNSIQRVLIAAAGNVTINAPASGTALAVSGIVDATQVIRSTGGSAPAAGLGLEISSDGTSGFVTAFNRSTSLYVPLVLRGLQWTFQTGNGLNTATINSTGNWTINAPTSGVPLTVTGPASGVADISVVAGSGVSGRVDIQDGQTGTRVWSLLSGGAGIGIFTIFDRTRAANALTIDTNGDWVIGTPASGTTLTVNGVAAANPAVLIASASSTGVDDLDITRTASTANSVQLGPNIALRDTGGLSSTLLQQSGGQTELWQFNSGAWHQLAFWNSNRALTLNAPASGDTLNVTALANNTAGTFTGSSTSGQSFGLRANAGTTSADWSLIANNQAGSTTYFKVRGDGQTIISGTTLVTTTAAFGAGQTATLDIGDVNSLISKLFGGVMIIQSANNMQFNVNNSTIAVSISATADIVARGVAICKRKSTDTTRTSTTTVTADPDLQYAIPAAGTYEIRATINCSAGAVGATPGLNIQIAFSGTPLGNSQGIVAGVMSNSGIPPSMWLINTTGAFSLNTIVGQNALVYEGVLETQGAGTVSVSWAQQNSSATGTVLNRDSFLTVTQLS